MVAAVSATRMRAVMKVDLQVEKVELRAGEVIGDERQEAAYGHVHRVVASGAPVLMGRVKQSVLASTADFGAVVSALGHEEFERVANQCLNALRERMRHAGSGGVPCDFVDDAALAVACTCVEDLVQNEHVRGPAGPEAACIPARSLARLYGAA